MAFKFLTCLFLVTLVFSSYGKVETKDAYEEEISKIFTIYHQALKSGDVTTLKKYSTERFVKLLGGEKEFQKSFKNLSKDYSNSKIHSSKIVAHSKDDSLFYGQIDYVVGDDHGHSHGNVEKSGGNWFFIVKKNGMYYFDHILTDFDPSHKDPPIDEKK